MPRTPQLVIPLAPTGGEVLGIRRVERETGLSKDTLRAWERRYGFPRPERNASGERAYTLDQIEKLRLLRRLTERGLRPGKIIALDRAQLENLSLAHEPPGAGGPDMGEFLDALREHDIQVLRRLLSQALMRKGLGAFVLDVVAPLGEQLAEERMRGDVEEFEARLCLEQMQGALQGAVHAVQHQGHPPRIVIASLQDSSRALDRLMLEALLSVGGALCIPLGCGLSARDVAHAAAAHRAQIVALETPIADQHAARGFSELRLHLPPAMELWALGLNLTRIRRMPQGVLSTHSVREIPAILQQWRRRHGQ